MTDSELIDVASNGRIGIMAADSDIRRLARLARQAHNTADIVAAACRLYHYTVAMCEKANVTGIMPRINSSDVISFLGNSVMAFSGNEMFKDEI